MSEKYTGGQAYPISFIESFTGDEVAIQGMTLRDYFAGQVLSNVKRSTIDLDGEDIVAEGCYLMADAMLKERNK
jgi:hypothetical protein